MNQLHIRILKQALAALRDGRRALKTKNYRTDAELFKVEISLNLAIALIRDTLPEEEREKEEP